MRSSACSRLALQPPEAITVAVACREGDWPYPEWPGADDRLRVRCVRFPHDTLGIGPCDVVVLRCRDPAGDLPRLRRAIGERSLPVLLVCPTADAKQVITALDHGATGYLVDGDLDSRALTSAVVSAVGGHTCLSVTACAALIKSFPPAPVLDQGGAGVREALAPREREVMDLLASGLTVTEIAQQLSLSGKTVRNYFQSIYTKLGVSGRTAAVLLWLGS
ncbi:response regulator transcription factor [Streptomyces collinus]|uniref:helix-turn-helix transcriptional regulator n=1 Tax=Streptomyces TaxID=1883 RepID=UPI003403749B